MGWGPVDWVERVLPEAKLKNTTTLLFEIFQFERPKQRYLYKTLFGDQLNGLGTSWLGGEGPPRSKIKKYNHLAFWNFSIWATETEISVENRSPL